MLVHKQIQAGGRPRDGCRAVPGGHPIAVPPPRAATSAPPPRRRPAERGGRRGTLTRRRAAQEWNAKRVGKEGKGSPDDDTTASVSGNPPPLPPPLLSADSASTSGCCHSPGRGGAPRDGGVVASSGGVWWRGIRISAGARRRAKRERGRPGGVPTYEFGVGHRGGNRGDHARHWLGWRVGD